MKRILVCCDLSDHSQPALGRASQLAERCSAALTICAILKDDFPSNMDDVLKREAMDELKRKCKPLGLNKTDFVVEIGETVTTVLSIADRIDADLIVLGSHRHRPILDLFNGSTIERIIHGSHRPVLLSPNPAKSTYSRVLSGVDFSPSCEAAMKLAHKIAPSAEFKTFHSVRACSVGWFRRAADPDEIRSHTTRAEKRLDAWWRDRKIPKEIDRPIVIPQSLPAAFREMRYEVKPDLFAIGANNESGALGNFAETIIRWQFCDVLVVRG